MTSGSLGPRDRPGPRGLRLLASALLLVDSLSAAVGVAGTLTDLPVHGLPALAMIALRGASGALEATGAWLLLQYNPAAGPIARGGVLLAAAYATLGIGARLAPTNLDPAFRLPVIAGYWAYALVMFTLLRRT